MQDLMYPNNISWLRIQLEIVIFLQLPHLQVIKLPLQMLQLVTPLHKHKNNLIRKLARWILGILVGTLFGSIPGLKDSSSPTIFNPLIKKAKDSAFLEKEDNLASFELIGRGGCGEVYKADLPRSNDKMIAIKKIVVAKLINKDTKIRNKFMRQIQLKVNTVGHVS